MLVHLFLTQFSSQQAQELGELARLHDDTTWALEGLSSGSGVAKQTSLATLAEIYSSRRNRLALHSSPLGNDFLTVIGMYTINLPCYIIRIIF